MKFMEINVMTHTRAPRFFSDNMQSKTRLTAKCAQHLLALLGGFCCLDFLGPTELLRTILALLPQLSGRFVNLGGKPRSNEPMSRLEFFLRGLIVVDQGKTGAPPSTKLCPEAESNHPGLVGFIHSCKLL